MVPTPTPAPAATRSAAAPTPPAGVPAACAADVRGEVFATGSLEERVEALRRYAAANAGKPASLVLTDALLTDSIRAQLTQPGAPAFESPAIRIQGDGVHVSGNARAAFFTFPISATLVPEVAGGTLRLAVRDLDTGALPGAVRDQISSLLERAADPAAWRMPLRVEDLVLRSGCGVVRGTALPS